MKKSMKKILITGADGFIGKNLTVRFCEYNHGSVVKFIRNSDPKLLRKLISQVDAVVHLAGENRPTNDDAFFEVNVGLTKTLCDALCDEYRDSRRKVPILFTSSIQADLNNAYGRSKLSAEILLKKVFETTGAPVYVFRLPGVFGKWCKPNYNSVVATFCYNISRDIPIQIQNEKNNVTLTYIDDVINEFLSVLENPAEGYHFKRVNPEYNVNIKDLADQLYKFKKLQTPEVIDRVGVGWLRALYSTYMSYIPTNQFAYCLEKNSDPRGMFVEVLKTVECGQFSFFTSLPGVSRGGHYHHTKSEKFLVIKGRAKFRFKSLLTNEEVELFTSDRDLKVVSTIPGWAHEITNTGDEEMFVMVWANEVFDHNNTDTIMYRM